MNENLLRNQLVKLLTGEESHMTFEQAVADFPEAHYNTKPPSLNYTPWHILEHLRITQKDILDFILVDGYKEQKWPDNYWPKETATADRKKWDATIEHFLSDNKRLQEITRDPNRNLTDLLPWGEPYTLIREITVVGNHNSYHIGEFAVLREIMGTWPKERKS